MDRKMFKTKEGTMLDVTGLPDEFIYELDSIDDSKYRLSNLSEEKREKHNNILKEENKLKELIDQIENKELSKAIWQQFLEVESAIGTYYITE